MAFHTSKVYLLTFFEDLSWNMSIFFFFGFSMLHHEMMWNFSWKREKKKIFPITLSFRPWKTSQDVLNIQFREFAQDSRGVKWWYKTSGIGITVATALCLSNCLITVFPMINCICAHFHHLVKVLRFNIKTRLVNPSLMTKSWERRRLWVRAKVVLCH